MEDNKTVSVTDLTPEQKKALMAELEQEQKAERDRVKAERANYKQMVHEAVMACLPVLRSASEQLSLAKEFCLDEFKTLLKLKAELYDIETDQQSHTFTSSDGKVSIILGYHFIDGWDDTVSSGIAIVEGVLDSLIHDATTKAIIKAMRNLLARDGKGNLQYKRLGKLKQMSEELNNARMKDGLKIIEDAYRPKRSTDYVKCLVTDEKGKKITLALSISDAPVVDKESIDLEPIDGAFAD